MDLETVVWISTLGKRTVNCEFQAYFEEKGEKSD